MALCAARRGNPGCPTHWSSSLFWLQKKEKKMTLMATLAFQTLALNSHVIKLYLSPEGFEFMTQSKYSLAAMESSTLFTSLVKLPSTCLLLNASALLCVSDLSTYTGAQYDVPFGLIFDVHSAESCHFYQHLLF